MKKSICFVLLGLFVTLAVGSTAFAEPGFFTYRKHYDINGIILMKIQAGSNYDQSGQHKSFVRGVGHLQREDYIAMGKEGMIVDSDSFWTADPESFRGLEVAGTFRLHDQYEGEGENEDAIPPADSPQVFAVSVDADSGESGQMSQAIKVDSSGEHNIFAIDQHAQTSDGTVKRYIDITDPASGAYLFEDSRIDGQVNITEMLNSADPNEDFTINTVSAMLDEDNKEAQSGDAAGKLFADSDEMAVLGESIDYNAEEEPPLVINGAEIFKSVVPLGTKIEELGLDEEIVFQSDLIMIKDIYVDWDDQLFGEYNPDVEGSYTFTGELVFPDTVAYDDKVLIFHVVDVVDGQVDDQSEQLEDTVHGGEDGEDEETDKETDS